METPKQKTFLFGLRPIDLLLFAIGTILITLRLDDAPLSNDEAAYVFRVHDSWRHMWKILAQDNYPAGYFIYIKSWTGVFGLGPLAIRLSSLPFALATWITFAIWVRQNLSSSVATLSIILLVLSPYHLFLYRLFKYFSLMNFLAILCFALFWNLVKNDRSLRQQRGNAAALFLASTFLAYVNYLGVIIVAILGLWGLIGWLRKRIYAGLQLFILQASTSILYIPQIYFLIVRLTVHHEETVSSSMTLKETIMALGYFGYSAFFGYTLEISHLFLVGTGLLAVGLSICLVLYSLISAATRKDDFESEAFIKFLFCIIVSMGPLCFLTLYFFLPDLPVMAYGERLSFLTPLMIVIIVYFISFFSKKILIPTGFFYFLPALYSVYHIYTFSENNNWTFRIEWGEMVEEVKSAESKPVYVVVDSWVMGYRGWYYFDDIAIYHGFRELEMEEELEDFFSEDLPHEGTLFYIRGAREKGALSDDTRMLERLRIASGEPDEIFRYTKDSDSMVRLKKLLRKGTDEETYSHKVEMLKYNLE